MKKTVLIVDDDAPIRQALRKLLQAEGYEVILAADGQEGLEQFGSKHIDLLLLDLNLPGMNGLQMLEELRQMKQPLSIPIVVMSTSNNPLDIAACYSFGAAGYILKPFKLEQYLEKIREITHYWFNTVMLPEERY